LIRGALSVLQEHLEGRMSKCSKGLFSALIVSVVLFCSGVVLGEISLVSPNVEVIEGDRQVEIFWSDPEPEDLTYIKQPVLGTVAFPWTGNAQIGSEGFYLGACDWTFNILVSLVADVWELSWREVINWRTGAQENKRIAVTDLETYYDLSDGIKVKIDDTGLFDSDLTGWSAPQPIPGGIFSGGDNTYHANPVVFSFTCTSGGELGVGGGTIGFDWQSIQTRTPEVGDLVRSGSFTVSQAGSPTQIYKGLKLTFPAGTYVSGEAFSLDVFLPLVDGDRFSIVAETFEGYLVLRHSIEDRTDQYKVISNISKCDSFEFFQDGQGLPAPYGERYYIDLGISAMQPGVQPEPDQPTVLNGFPYSYTVVTYDMSETHQEEVSTPEWRRVYPSVPPATSVNHVYVVPNPYVREAGWEEGDSKLQFVNVPEGTVIRIYDAAGDYVNTVYPNRYSYDPGKLQGTVDWDLRNADGTKVVSGIYIYRLESDRGEKTGRFIVVR
jgi:hypothetical protein